MSVIWVWRVTLGCLGSSQLISSPLVCHCTLSIGFAVLLNTICDVGRCRPAYVSSHGCSHLFLGILHVVQCVLRGRCCLLPFVWRSKLAFLRASSSGHLWRSIGIIWFRKNLSEGLTSKKVLPVILFLVSASEVLQGQTALERKMQSRSRLPKHSRSAKADSVKCCTAHFNNIFWWHWWENLQLAEIGCMWKLRMHYNCRPARNCGVDPV